MEYCKTMDDIKCPHCGYSHVEDYEGVPWTDDRDIEKKCNGCGHEFIIKADISVQWTTHKDEDDD